MWQTKKMLDFLAEVGKNPKADPNTESITDRMLSTTPILEGFGNANMPRNPDSSRFGKLYKVFFDPHSQMISGCEIENYMLEKSRVASQQILERNFHAFYRMVLGKWGSDGLPADGVAKYKIKGIMDYEYLKGGIRRIPDEEVLQHERPVATSKLPKAGDVENFQDAENMVMMYKAMQTFFDEAAIDSILASTMGCLWMGNIQITGDVETSEVVDSGASKEAIDAVAGLWEV